MVQRVTYRRRCSYRTKSNRIKIVKTPGGKLTAHIFAKKASAPKCGGCGVKLHGVPTLRPRQYANVAKAKKTVTRAYGGCLCANCVRSRVVRAFLIEEANQVKAVTKSKQ